LSALLASSTHAAWPWPDSLDALVAAPAYHDLLLENERVRVIYTHIPSGATVPVHTHRWSSVAYLLSWSDFIRRDHHGNVLLDSRQSEAAHRQIVTKAAPSRILGPCDQVFAFRSSTSHREGAELCSAG
jgi:hypothetical protein